MSIPVSVPLKEFDYNTEVEITNPMADTAAITTFQGANIDWYGNPKYGSSKSPCNLCLAYISLYAARKWASNSLSFWSSSKAHGCNIYGKTALFKSDTA